MLHRQVQGGRCLAAAAHAHQHDVRSLQVAPRLAVVMFQREIDGVDAVVVLAVLAGIAEAAHPVVRLQTELFFQRLHEGLDHVEDLAVAGLEDVEHVVVGQGGEHDRPLALALAGGIDFAHHLERLVHRVDERPAHMPRLDRELRQDGIAQGFGGDAGAIGHEKDTAIGHGASPASPRMREDTRVKACVKSLNKAGS